MIVVRLTAPFQYGRGPSFGTSEVIALPDAEADRLLAAGGAVPHPLVSPEEKTMEIPSAHKMVKRTKVRTKSQEGR